MRSVTVIGHMVASVLPVLIVAGLHAIARGESPVSVRYDVSPVYDGTTVRALDIALSTTLPASGKMPLVLPSKWAAASDLWDNVEVTPTAAFAKIDDGEGTLTGEPYAHVVLRYRVSQHWNGALVRSTYFKPIFTSTFFVATGAGALIYPSLDGSRASVSFEWHGRPQTFAADCLSGESGNTETLRESEIQNCLLYGGDFQTRRTDLSDGTVNAYLAERWPFTLDAFTDRLRGIIEYERRFWRELHTPQYAVIQIPTDEPAGYFGGTAYTHAFVLYVPRESPLGEGINHLFTHEYFHNWNPKRLFDLAQPEAREYWFSEGFTEYYSYKLMRKMGLTDPLAYLEGINANIRWLWLSPNARLSNDQVAARYFEGAITPIDYVRGQLAALDWNARIASRTGGERSLDDAFRGVAAAKGSAPADTGYITRTFAPYVGLSAASKVRSNFESGALPAVPPGIFGHCARLKTEAVYDFDPGFDLHASGLSGVLKGVRDGGPAYRAGLREGETFSRHPVSPQAWQPITITIRDGTGEHQVTYFPQGAAHGVPQYVPIMPAARFNECFRAGKLDP